MQYFVSFLEGMITFISPCLLPMLPIYISYFAGGGERSVKKSLIGAAGFVTGFTLVFVAMGALAGTVGSLLRAHQSAVNFISGMIVILFGLNFLGLVFSVGWTPCVGAFLGSALMLASQQGHVLEGMLMLLSYSLGLGIPFLLSAVLIDYLKSTFDFIKRNYKVINMISGLMLIIIGILMMTGMMGQFLNLLS